MYPKCSFQCLICVQEASYMSLSLHSDTKHMDPYTLACFSYKNKANIFGVRELLMKNFLFLQLKSVALL